MLIVRNIDRKEMKKENTSQTNVFETRKVPRFVIERRLVRIAEHLYSSAPYIEPRIIIIKTPNKVTSKPKNSIGGIASANSGFVSGVAWIPTETI